MHWIAYVLLTTFFLTIQVAWGPRIELLGVRPDILLVFVVFLALHGQPLDAVLGSWILGFAADLMSIEQIGLYSVSYALAAMLVLSVREYLFCFRSSSRFAVTLIVAVALQTTWMCYASWRYGWGRSPALEFFVYVLPASCYTAVLAVLVHKLLTPLVRILGFVQPRYSHEGLNRMVAGRV